MVTTPTTPATPSSAAPPSGAAAVGAAPTHPPALAPGGMASDPAAALANEIVTNIKGAADRFKQQIESTPALKALMDQAGDDLTAGVAKTIRTFVDGEVAKATGGIVPKPASGTVQPPTK